MKTFLIPVQGLFGISKSILHVSHLDVRTNAAVNTFIILSQQPHLDVRTNAVVNTFIIRSQRPFLEIIIWMLTLFLGTTLDVGYSVQNNEVPWTALDIDTNRPKFPVVYT